MTLATLNATYAGGAPVNGATYTIAAPAVHPFMIEGNELVIPAGASLDYEATQSYDLTIAATANGTTATPITVTVNVGNIDDEDPTFGTIPAGVTVQAGTTTLNKTATITATDGDAPPVGNNNDISYAFVDGSDAIIAPNGLGLSILGNFAINANTGVITVASAPTFLGTAADTRTLTIRATDTTAGATGQTADETITITVTPPATFAIAATPNNTPSIDERTTGGKVTLATLNATYAGGAPVNGAIYTIESASPSTHPFMITGNELVIPAGASLDYEATQSYTLTIAANVDGSTASPITVTVNVGNIDDENPTFGTIPAGVTVQAGTTTLNKTATITATDGDAPPVGNNNDISYAFVDGSDAIIAPNGLGLSILGNFAINANTGEITVASAPTFSTTPTDNTRTLTIRATDTTAGATGQTADATITITVTPPATFAIAATPNTASIDERTTGGKVTLATLNATYAGGAPVNGAIYEIDSAILHLPTPL